MVSVEGNFNFITDHRRVSSTKKTSCWQIFVLLWNKKNHSWVQDPTLPCRHCVLCIDSFHMDLLLPWDLFSRWCFQTKMTGSFLPSMTTTRMISWPIDHPSRPIMISQNNLAAVASRGKTTTHWYCSVHHMNHPRLLLSKGSYPFYQMPPPILSSYNNASLDDLSFEVSTEDTTIRLFLLLKLPSWTTSCRLSARLWNIWSWTVSRAAWWNPTIFGNLYRGTPFPAWRPYPSWVCVWKSTILSPCKCFLIYWNIHCRCCIWNESTTSCPHCSGRQTVLPTKK